MSAVTVSALMDDGEIRAAVAVCRKITRARAANFYWGLRLTPEPRRSAMYTIYAWMREADDIVDGQSSYGTTASSAIDAFRIATVDALTGRTNSREPLWRALAAVAREYPLDGADFHAMIDGQVADLQCRRLTDWPELRGYCQQVASTVGTVCVRIWGYNDPRALQLAQDRGIAFQLTNILRDVVEDVSLGRVYIPTEDFDRTGITPEDLCAWSKPAQCEQLMFAMIARARAHFACSESLDGMIDPSCRPTLWALTEIYRGLLDRIARDPSQIARKRVSLPTFRKVIIALQARSMSGRGAESIQRTTHATPDAQANGSGPAS